MTEPTFVRVRNVPVGFFGYRIIIEAWHDNMFMGMIMFKGDFPYNPQIRSFCEAILKDFDMERVESFRSDIAEWAGIKHNTRIYGLSVAEYNALPEASRYFLALGAK